MSQYMPQMHAATGVINQNNQHQCIAIVGTDQGLLAANYSEHIQPITAEQKCILCKKTKTHTEEWPPCLTHRLK